MNEKTNTPRERLEAEVVTVIGGGNAAFAVAGDLGSRGARIRLLELGEFLPRLEKLASERRLRVTGAARDETCLLDMVTDDPRRALAGVETVIVAAPAFAHERFAALTASFIEPGAMVMVFTGGFGALAWYREAKRARGTLDFVLAETNTLPYAARIRGGDEVHLLLELDSVCGAVFPASRRAKAARRIKRLYPNVVMGRDLLESALRNVNGVIHPPVLLMNVQQMEASGGKPWWIWRDGVTPSVARLVEAVDAERVALARSFGFELPDAATEQWLCGYGVRDSILESLSGSAVLGDIRGPVSLSHRFFEEDVPYFMDAWLDLARAAGAACPVMAAVGELVRTVLPAESIAQSRTMAQFGLGSLDAEDLVRFLQDPAPFESVVPCLKTANQSPTSELNQ